MEFFSEALGTGTRIQVILPEAQQGIGQAGKAVGGRGGAPVLYLLHGLSDDETIWARRTSIERYAAAKGLAVVMPRADRSFYANEAQGNRYWDFISEELPRTVQSFFHVSGRREDTFVAGLSMGGYGALKLALRHPERYAAAASFSGVVDIVDAMRQAPHWAVFPDGLFERIFGSVQQLQGSDDDLFALLGRPAPACGRPRLYLACGGDDAFYPAHLRFVQAARQAGWAPTAREQAGAGHAWPFWDAQIQAALDWML